MYYLWVTKEKESGILCMFSTADELPNRKEIMACGGFREDICSHSFINDAGIKILIEFEPLIIRRHGVYRDGWGEKHWNNSLEENERKLINKLAYALQKGSVGTYMQKLLDELME